MACRGTIFLSWFQIFAVFWNLYVFFWVFLQPLKMDLTEGSETSAKHNLTPGKYPKENIQTIFLCFPPVNYDLGCRREIEILESSSKRLEQRLRAENEWLDRDFQARITRMQVCNCYITLICIFRGHSTVRLEIQNVEQIIPQRCEVAVYLKTVVQLYQAMWHHIPKEHSVIVYFNESVNYSNIVV
jgi:hypothetical protein